MKDDRVESYLFREIPPKVMRILALCLLTTMGVILFIFQVYTEREQERWQRRMIKWQFNGIVIDKFIDGRAHVLKVNTNTASKYDTLINVRSWVNLYENSQIGDSIYKKKGSSKIYLVRFDRINEFNFNPAYIKENKI